MKRSLALLAVAAVFFTGVAVGVLGLHLYQAGRLHGHGPLAHLHRGGGPGGPPPFLEDLEDELAMTPEQRRQVHAILEESRQEAEALREEVAPRVHSTMRDAHRRIMEILTPEQRKQVDEMHPRLRRHLGEGLRRRHQDGAP
jgi:Spy/CpxP family protein refolding chaperone